MDFQLYCSRISSDINGINLFLKKAEVEGSFKKAHRDPGVPACLENHILVSH